MPLPNMILINFPPFVIFALIMMATLVFSVAATLIFHRFISHRSLKAHNDIAGPIFSTLGVVYAVLLGFVVVSVWENFDRTRLNVEMEVNCLANLYVDSKPFEEGFRSDVRSALRDYAMVTVAEWEILARGERNMGARDDILKLISLYSSYTPRNEAEKIFLTESVKATNKLLDLRIQRVSDASAGVHPLLWFVLLLGGAVSVIFTIFFGTDQLPAKIVMTTMLALVIALVLFTILEFSLPLTGFASVSCEPFEQFLSQTSVP